MSHRKSETAVIFTSNLCCRRCLKPAAYAPGVNCYTPFILHALHAVKMVCWFDRKMCRRESSGLNARTRSHEKRSDRKYLVRVPGGCTVMDCRPACETKPTSTAVSRGLPLPDVARWWLFCCKRSDLLAADGRNSKLWSFRFRRLIEVMIQISPLFLRDSRTQRLGCPWECLEDMTAFGEHGNRKVAAQVRPPSTTGPRLLTTTTTDSQSRLPRPCPASAQHGMDVQKSSGSQWAS
ncbi:hypothetical protein B0H65DRAFT_445125 [Neurospora tetraspora]|uniref:Uncharacterized protein n=1 Tax=Neurospora tetraspora TaxID=94610 RepID=A0AAE0J922_9PEZI|nr:hypothetical protein B0H65DRAFT_445125 [Neurospora tetraspora]